MSASELAPGLRQLRETAARDGRQEAQRVIRAVLCEWCDQPTVRGSWLCTCRPEPDWTALDAAALMTGRAA